MKNGNVAPSLSGSPAALGDAATRQQNVIIRIAATVIGPVLAYFFVHHFNWWLVVAVLTALALNVLRRQFVAVRDGAVNAPGQSAKPWRVLGVLAGIALVMWLADAAVPALRPPAPVGTEIFYPSAVEPLFLALLFGFAVYLLAQPRCREKLIQRGVGYYRFCCGTFVVLAAGAVVASVATVVMPSPSVVLMTDGLDCGRQGVRWADITDIQEVAGRKWHEYARLTLDAPLVAGGAVFSCQIDGTTAGYQPVYDAIRSAWLRNRQSGLGLRLTPG